MNPAVTCEMDYYIFEQEIISILSRFIYLFAFFKVDKTVHSINN